MPKAKNAEPVSRLSKRSSTPPWPGNTLPVSFRPTVRLCKLMNRSPAAETSTVTMVSITRAGTAGGVTNVKWDISKATGTANTTPPIRPSSVFPGLIDGASL